MARQTSEPEGFTGASTVTGAGAPADDETPITADDHGRARRPAPPVFGPATKVGRFVILEKLGEGGMGTVYAAYDSLLDRKVAVKVVRADRRRDLAGLSSRERLLREAQAMARLSHPNVVAVLEVGELADDVYLALEYIDGTTLKKWLRAEQRSWREVVAAYLQAGRGLAAAHAAGLVHRDVKPDNVLIRHDGRIQVTDFGVASMGGAGHDHSPSSPFDAPSPSPEQHTYAGLRVGTPAYMAPEQHAGEANDARTDQFGFCVALWEGLYGVRPFAGKGSDELARAVRDGEIRTPPRDADVPRWIEAPVRRGLSADPARRWPSMDDLLAELARDPVAARRRTVAIAATAVAIAGTATLAWAGWTRDRSAGAAPCQGADRHLEGVWDEARASDLRLRFAASGLPSAAAAADRVIDRFDTWAGRWVAMHHEACKATRVHGDQSDAMLDKRMHCLDRQRVEVGELANALTVADAEVVSRAVEAAAELPLVADCADREALTTAVARPSDPAVREQVEAIERDLARAEAQKQIGRYRAGREIATAASDAAEPIDYLPVRGRALLARGTLETQDGDLDAARATLEVAVAIAGEARDDLTMARALFELVATLADQSRGAEALAVGIVATAVVARTGSRELESELLTHLGSAHEVQGDFAAAETVLTRALAIREKDDVERARILNRLGGLHDQQARPDDARRAYEHALRILIAQLGDDHPKTAVTRANLCYLDVAAGKLAEARECQEGVLTSLERALGPEHPQVAWALNEVALSQQEQGDLAGARDRFLRALVIWQKTSGPDHPDLAWPLVNLASIALESGDKARAEELCRRAMRIVEAAHGAEHPDLVEPLACLGQAVRARGDAIELLRRAHALAVAPEVRKQIADWLRARGSAP